MQIYADSLSITYTIHNNTISMPYLCHGLGFVIYCFFYFFCYVLMCLVMTFHFLSLSVFCLFSVYTWVLFVHSCVLITLGQSLCLYSVSCTCSPASTCPLCSHFVLCIFWFVLSFVFLFGFSLGFPWPALWCLLFVFQLIIQAHFFFPFTHLPHSTLHLGRFVQTSTFLFFFHE